jgi:MYXO-CTERM domain-containing protein
LHAAGAAIEPRVVAQGCDAIAAGSRGAAGWWMVGLLGVGWLMRVRRSREVT